jgi:DNA-binding MarR family transcriptional regulator
VPRPPAPSVTADARVLDESLRQLSRVLRTAIRSDVAWEKQLPMAQVELLVGLDGASPARVNDLAERLRLAQSTVSGLISQMMANGLVERAVDPTDRRAAIVTVTPLGAERLAAWREKQIERLGRALAGLEPHERELILAALPALDRFADLLRAAARD